MLSGGLPRLDMALAQALWSEEGDVTELQAMVGLQFPSRERSTGKEALTTEPAKLRSVTGRNKRGSVWIGVDTSGH
ncbi:hypothetical protein EYF80_024920 [Liparis tanakae]|uniref:Uncharacterized protein n=1 Tax=Liparis tanakae TaxID=230148 RepID=A0A4Z2HG35_9TELE|nr:hypothetical protein EYF80_024920 [Liparis tanakae]